MPLNFALYLCANTTKVNKNKEVKKCQLSLRPPVSLLNLIKNETKVSKIKGGKNCQLSPQPLVFGNLT